MSNIIIPPARQIDKSLNKVEGRIQKKAAIVKNECYSCDKLSFGPHAQNECVAGLAI